MDTKNQYETHMLSDSFTTPPPYSSASGSQTLDVHYRDWKSNIVVTDSAGQEMFSLNGSRSSLRLEIVNRNKQVIGYSKSDSSTSRIDVEINNATGARGAFEIHNSSCIFGGSPQYISPAFDGREVTWKNKAWSSKIIYTLIDGRGMAVAKFQSDPKSKIGKLEITDEVTGEDRLNEVAVTLLTILHRKLRNIQGADMQSALWVPIAVATS
jgi:hypothetical protein